jgi:hypothetical protein
MTFQVALVASDGILIASDRKIAIRSSDANSPSGLQFMEGNKFAKTKDESVICFFAGGPQSSLIAAEIIEKAPKEIIDTPPRDTAWMLFLKSAAEGASGNSLGDEVIVVRKNIPDIFLVTRQQKAAGAVPVPSRLCTGANVTARFLTQHFYRANTPLRSLMPLALSTLHYAEAERPSDIGYGFDVLTVEKGTTLWQRYGLNDKRMAAIVERFRQSVDAIVMPSDV